MELLGYIAAIVIGISLGLIGGGGSILTVPVLVYLFSVDAVSATAYSLFIVGFTAAIGSIAYFKKGLVNTFPFALICSGFREVRALAAGTFRTRNVPLRSSIAAGELVPIPT